MDEKIKVGDQCEDKSDIAHKRKRKREDSHEHSLGYTPEDALGFPPADSQEHSHDHLEDDSDYDSDDLYAVVEWVS